MKQEATLLQRQTSHREILESLIEFDQSQPELQAFKETLEQYVQGKEANGVCLLPKDGVKLIYDLVDAPNRQNPTKAASVVVMQSIVSIKKSQDLLKALTTKSFSNASVT